MLPDGLIDSLMPLLPNVKAVTLYRPRDADALANPVVLQARREDYSTEQMQAFEQFLGGAEGDVFFIPVDQTGYVRPRNKWLLVATGFDGSRWTVVKDDLGIQQRGVAVLVARVPD